MQPVRLELKHPQRAVSSLSKYGQTYYGEDQRHSKNDKVQTNATRTDLKVHKESHKEEQRRLNEEVFQSHQSNKSVL